jgi:hypothetical protein
MGLLTGSHQTVTAVTLGRFCWGDDALFCVDRQRGDPVGVKITGSRRSGPESVRSDNDGNHRKSWRAVPAKFWLANNAKAGSGSKAAIDHEPALWETNETGQAEGLSCFLCAEHVRQHGGENPLHNVMDVK